MKFLGKKIVNWWFLKTHFFFLSWPFWTFFFVHFYKICQRFLDIKDVTKVWWLPWPNFQPKITQPKYFSPQCIIIIWKLNLQLNVYCTNRDCWLQHFYIMTLPFTLSAAISALKTASMLKILKPSSSRNFLINHLLMVKFITKICPLFYQGNTTMDMKI